MVEGNSKQRRGLAVFSTTTHEANSGVRYSNDVRETQQGITKPRFVLQMRLRSLLPHSLRKPQITTQSMLSSCGLI